jgi:hypothetical protein
MVTTFTLVLNSELAKQVKNLSIVFEIHVFRDLCG